MNEPWRIELLGGLRARQGELEITRFRSHKTASLLAYLAFYPRIHSREVLIDQFWQDYELGAGRNYLSKALSSLRHQLEPPGVPHGAVVVADRFHVRLRAAAFTLDTADFESALRRAGTSRSEEGCLAALQRAIELYTGELMPGFYDEWVLFEQKRLSDLFTQASSHYARLRDGTRRLPCDDSDRHEASNSGETRPAQVSNIRLPLTFSRFVGRERETAQLVERLDRNSRIVTLTGPGGIGKTRLAIEVARQSAGLFAGGIYFVPLANLPDPRLIPGAIVDALHLPRSPGAEPLAQIVDWLNGHPGSLLVLDNFEHLLARERRMAEDGAAAVLALLEHVPTLALLVTSRQRLDLTGEQEYLVPPLPTPAEGLELLVEGQATLKPQLSTLSRNPCVALFVDRAQMTKPDFQVTARNATAVAALCNRLEGIPLAIELAAARTQVMTPSQILIQLERRLDFLVSRKRDAADRHRTLRSALEWSYRLLSPDLQRFFARLSVFRGGWTVEAAEIVCEEAQAMEYLALLQECSLVQTADTGEEVRFRMLETLREYGVEQLKTGTDALWERHASYYLRLAEEAKPNLAGPEQVVWLYRLEQEVDNLRAGLQWAQEHRPDDALRLANALWRFWHYRGESFEGRSWLETALAKGINAAPDLRAEGMYSASLLAVYATDNRGKTLGEECLMVARAANHPPSVARALSVLCLAALEQGDIATASALLEEALPLCRGVGDPTSVSLALNCAGYLAMAGGDEGGAILAFEECLAIGRKAGDFMFMPWPRYYLAALSLMRGDLTAARSQAERGLKFASRFGAKDTIAHAVELVGRVLLAHGELQPARHHFAESLAMVYDMGMMLCVAHNLEGFARMALAEDRATRAVCLLGAAESLLNAIELTLLPFERAFFDASLAAAESSLSTENFAAARIEGQAMTVEQAITYALDERKS